MFRRSKATIRKSPYDDFRAYIQSKAVWRWWIFPLITVFILVGGWGGFVVGRTVPGWIYLSTYVVYGGLVGMLSATCLLLILNNLNYSEHEQRLISQGMDWLEQKHLSEAALKAITERAEIGSGSSQLQSLLPSLIISIVLSSFLPFGLQYIVSQNMVAQTNAQNTSLVIPSWLPFLVSVVLIVFLFIMFGMLRDLLRGNTDSIIRAAVAEYRCTVSQARSEQPEQRLLESRSSVLGKTATMLVHAHKRSGSRKQSGS